MPFMVIYSTSDGASCHEQADAIDEAALYVERLRNSEGIEEIRIYRMEEISFAFRPYYKVELGMPERQAATPPSEAARPVLPPAADEPVDVREPLPPVDVVDPTAPADAAPLPSTTDPEGRRGLFGR